MSKRKGTNSLNLSELINSMPNNSNENTNSANQLIMPTLQPFHAGTSTHYYASHRSSIPLPKFSGDPQELTLFISTLNDRATVERWSDIELLNAVRNSLEGQARQFFLQCNEISPIKTSAEIFNKLKEFFQPEGSAVHKQNFDAICMLPNETVRNLQHRIDFLTKKVYPEINDKTALNSIKFDKLMCALPNNLKQQIYFKINTKNYEDAVKAAIDAQNFMLETQLLSRTPEATENCQINVLQARIDSQNSKIDELSKQLESVTAKPSEKPKEFFRHSSKYKSRGRFSHKEHSNNCNNFKFNNLHQNRQSQNFRHKRFTPPFRPIRGRHFNSHHNNNVHHSTDNRNSYQYTSCSVPQASTQVNQPVICDVNSSQVTCQICYNIGHSARDCPSAKVWFDLKESITPSITFPPNELPRH